jgi:hypothetical protein
MRQHCIRQAEPLQRAFVVIQLAHELRVDRFALLHLDQLDTL